MIAPSQLVESPVRAAYSKLRAAAGKHPYPTAQERKDWLTRLEKLVAKRGEAFAQAIDQDFGGRSRQETWLADIVTTLETIRAAKSNLRAWMEPRPASPSVYFLPSRAFVEPLPKGVVGIISPWNYPVNLALAPLACALAAGNRALVKPSELTPRTAALIAEAIRETFTAEEVAVVEGGPDVAREVTQLPLDHLLFTGSTQVGALVAQAAAKNLVPVTLELGGKSPALVHPDYSVDRAAERIALGKLFNGGQTCIAPDYVLLPEGKEAAFASAFRAAVERSYPTLATGTDYTAMASAKGFDRMRALAEDAKAKGARLEVVSPGGEPAPQTRKFPPTLVFAPTAGMRVMQEEIFGPLLPVQTFATFEEALEFIHSRPRPLAFYYFDNDEDRVDRVLQSTPSGGACINDTLVHFVQEELPFGGIGQSGMGAYHGLAGFDAFSHLRSVLKASALSAARRVQSPPYGKVLDAAISFMVGRWRRN